MIICNTTYNVDSSVVDQWICWVKETYVPQIMKLGFFLENQLARVMVDEQMGGATFCLQFTAQDMDVYANFESNHVANYDAMLLKKYNGKVVMFRTLMEIV